MLRTQYLSLERRFPFSDKENNCGALGLGFKSLRARFIFEVLIGSYEQMYYLTIKLHKGEVEHTTKDPLIRFRNGIKSKVTLQKYER